MLTDAKNLDKAVRISLQIKYKSRAHWSCIAGEYLRRQRIAIIGDIFKSIWKHPFANHELKFKTESVCVNPVRVSVCNPKGDYVNPLSGIIPDYYFEY